MSYLFGCIAITHIPVGNIAKKNSLKECVSRTWTTMGE